MLNEGEKIKKVLIKSRFGKKKKKAGLALVVFRSFSSNDQSPWASKSQGAISCPWIKVVHNEGGGWP